MRNKTKALGVCPSEATNALGVKKIIFKISILIFLLAIVLSTGPSFVLASKTIANNKINLDLKVNNKNFDKQNRKIFVENQIVVKYKNDNKAFRVINLPAGTSVEETVVKYKKNKNVEYAEPNYMAYADEVPNDPYYFPYQWHMDNETGSGVNAEQAWDISTGEGVIVAVIDTGLNLGGEDTPVCLKPGKDFINNDLDPNDDNGHGTHVAGTIAQSTNNDSVGVAGLAYNSCIMPLKALGADGGGSYAAIANAIIFATDNGADVINMSLGGDYNDITLASAVQYAHNNGVVVVAAAGNSSSDAPHYPSSYETVISVGATGYDKSLASYSNYGLDIDVVAPGGDMYEYTYNRRGKIIGETTKDLNDDGYPDGVLQETFDSESFGYSFYQGTSMASPHVAGAAALLISYAKELGQELSSMQVREALQNTAEDLGEGGWDQYFGYGLIDAYAVLSSLGDLPVNQAPTAVINIAGELIEYNELTFDASASTDSDGDTLSYTWNFGDGSSEIVTTEDIVLHNYDEHGIYTVSLNANDANGGIHTVTTDINIANINDVPVAVAGHDQTIHLGDIISFNASSSYDVDGDALSFVWDFGDGTTGAGVSSEHKYLNVGVYDVTLSVDDGNEGEAIDTLKVTVEPAQASIVMTIDSLKVDYNQRAIFYNGIATVVIINSVSLAPVPGVTVTGDWSGLVNEFNVSGVTNDFGELVLTSSVIKKPGSGNFIFTIKKVERDGDEWDGDLILSPGLVTIY